MFVQVCCWRRRETKRREAADVFHVFCGACIMSIWLAGGLFMCTAGEM